jgi:hypothetical protein
MGHRNDTFHDKKIETQDHAYTKTNERAWPALKPYVGPFLQANDFIFMTNL